MAEDFQELLDCWENRPENTPGCDWVIPPARDELGRIVGDDYPYQARFNTPGHEALANPGVGQGGAKKSKGAPAKNKQVERKDVNPIKDMSREELVKAMKDKGMTDEEIAKWLDGANRGSGK
jgi:hypothetical protein